MTQKGPCTLFFYHSNPAICLIKHGSVFDITTQILTLCLCYICILPRYFIRSTIQRPSDILLYLPGLLLLEICCITILNAFINNKPRDFNTGLMTWIYHKSDNSLTTQKLNSTSNHFLTGISELISIVGLVHHLVSRNCIH